MHEAQALAAPVNVLTVAALDPRCRLIAVFLQFTVSIRRQHAAAREVRVNHALRLVDAPRQRLGDLWRRRAGFGQQCRRGAAVVVEVEVAALGARPSTG
jgi:hypothetical protein